MKKINLLFIITLCFFTSSLFAQKKAAPNKPSLPSIKSCNADIDTSKSNKMSIATFQEWSNSSKLTVNCSDGKSYLLHQFGIQVFVKNPMEMKDFGIGNDGFPIMAKKAITKLQPGDTVILKDVIGFDEKQSEIKLPGFSIIITE